MNIAQRLKMVWNISGKNFLESNGVDCSAWTTKYRAVTYGWEFKVLDDKGEEFISLYFVSKPYYCEITYKDNLIAMGLADILKRA